MGGFQTRFYGRFSYETMGGLSTRLYRRFPNETS